MAEYTVRDLFQINSGVISIKKIKEDKEDTVDYWNIKDLICIKVSVNYMELIFVGNNKYKVDVDLSLIKLLSNDRDMVHRVSLG